MDIINPANEAIIASLKEHGNEFITIKHQQLLQGQKEWSSLDINKRIQPISNFSELLSKEMNNLAEVLTSETGKPLAQSVNEIKGARSRIQFFIDHSEKWLQDETVYSDDQVKECIAYEPLGVIANISAWNYPYLIGVNVFVPALIGGNAVLYKPSEYATLTGLAIQELLHKAGIPNDVFAAVIGGMNTGQALLDLPLDGYFFTGSNKTGAYIYQKVAKKMVPCQLELGGKDPLYVTDDNKDLNAIAKVVAEGAFYNNGQSCCSVERIYVHRSVYSHFVKAFTKEVGSYKMGDPMDPNTFIGPLTRQQQTDVLEAQIADAVQKGANVVIGGKRGPAPYYFEPTVLTDVNHSMEVMKEESFGPIIGLQRVANDEEAISLMQDTAYGLTASVYTQDKKRAEKIMDAMDTGTVYWNCCDRVSPNLPWSGRNNSGLGATLSYHGIRAFTQPKAYHFRNP
jgi:acyl-CoA reductase-like NAD-dependent aldehyde dehydrogenase